MATPDATMKLSLTEHENVIALISSNGDYTDMALSVIKDRDEVKDVESGSLPGSAWIPEMTTEHDNNLSLFRFNIFLDEDTDADEFLGILAGDLQSTFDTRHVRCSVSVAR